jgi:hypothetical protein
MYAPQVRRITSRRRERLCARHESFLCRWLDTIKADAIAARQMAVLQKFQGPREWPVRVPDIKETFLQMRDQI